MSSNRRPGKPGKASAGKGGAPRKPRPAAKPGPRGRKPPQREGVPLRSAPPRVEPSDVHHPDGVRLQKILAAAGIASRRAAENLITGGRVTVDGVVVTSLGTRVDPDKARVEVDGERIGTRPGREYIVLNKPVGYITTASDPLGRKTVLDLVRTRGRRLFPVGRLDADTTGLLLLTDDGELAHRLSHPRYKVERIYVAKVEGVMTPAAVRRLAGGVRLDDGPAKPVRVRVRGETRRSTQVEVVMTEGRKREVRRMLEAIEHPVIELARVGFGSLRLGSLPLGGMRKLTPAEVGTLYRLVGL